MHLRLYFSLYIQDLINALQAVHIALANNK